MNQYPNDNASSESHGPTLRQVYSNNRPSQNSQRFLPRRSHSERTPHPPPPFSDSYRRDHDLPPLPISALPFEARREGTIATERKRRLTASATEAGRRRTTTGGFTSRDNRYYQTHVPPGRDSTRSAEASSGMAEREVIDLTGSSPVAPENTTLPQRSPVQRPRTPSNSSRGYIVPKWQPDGEVSECPICHRPFSFLFRRHHCRKCGRVVCNDCSPHRITIPRQYIVHPPGTLQDPLSPFDLPTIDLTRGSEDDDYGVRSGLYRRPNPALGGGEKVRLCNPCVPDPQPEFDAVLRSPTSNRAPVDTGSDNARSSAFTSFPIFQYPAATDSSRLTAGDRRYYGQLPHPGTRVHLGQGDDNDDSDSSSEAYSSGPRYHYMGHHRDRFSPPITHRHSRYHSLDSRQGPLPPLPPFNNRPRVTSMFDPSRPQYGVTPGFQLGLPPRPDPQTTPSGLQPPRPTIREEDMCPVCRGVLPPKGPNGDETDRENHIMECISQHDTSTPASRQRASTAEGTSQPPQTTFSSSMPAQTIPHGASGPTPPVASSSSTPPHRTMPTQMLRFPATEKDCTPQTNSDGGLDASVTECSICMVEYEVGDRLVRLECWCKFHEDCIVEWFGRKAECPVHKLS